MQIHELNNFNGELDNSVFLAVDNGSDTGKVSAAKIVQGVTDELADAESSLNARIDNIIAGGAAPSEAEIIDARLGAADLGNTPYNSLGAAIRGQVTDLNNDILAFTGNKRIPMIGKNQYISLSGASVTMVDGVPQSSGTSQLYSYGLIACYEGMEFTINAAGGNDTRAWGFVDASGNIVDVCPASANYTGEIITAPTNAAWLIVHTRDGRISYVGRELSSIVSELNTTIQGSPINVYKKDYAILTTGKWSYQVNGGYIIPVNGGDEIILKNESQSYYSLLKSADNIVAGSNADFATGYTGPVLFNANTEVKIIAPSDARYLWLVGISGGVDLTPDMVSINGFNVFESIVGNIQSIAQEQRKPINTYDIAKGKTDELSPFDGTNLQFETVSSYQKRSPQYGRVVAINHDDLQPSDYINIRKIYNKYGFNANLNLILMPFANQNDIDAKSVNVKRMVADGNNIGLHAIMNSSFWWVNKMFDVRPDKTFTYAPTLNELKTVVSDGRNVFGHVVDLTLPLSNYGFVTLPSQYVDTPIGDLTNDDYVNIIGSYTFLFNTNTFTGLDLDGVSRSWTMLEWLEHWYNRLIDSSLGYSTRGSFTDLYSNYATGNGAVYPDAEHLATGKIVFYDDTSNPNYNRAGYQLVGKFTKGLYKGAATCCNYEVRSRCIEIAKAFAKHYFDINNFTLYGRHGNRLVELIWYDGNIPYEDRDHTILAGEYGRVYNSIEEEFETGFDVLLNNGIRTTAHQNPQEVVFIGQRSMFYGQEESHYPFFNVADMISYLTLASTSLSNLTGTGVDNAALSKILGEHDNLIKYVYEKAKQLVSSSDGSASYYILGDVKAAIDLIRSCLDTGKIPVLSVDTIVNLASNIYAVEVLCMYCWKNNISIVPMETARELATSRSRQFKNNYFPNPKFSSSILVECEGSSTSNDAYRPDGWKKGYGNLSNSVAIQNGNVVYSEKVDGNTVGPHTNSVEIWGLPPGDYVFSFEAKQTGSSGYISLSTSKNGTGIYSTETSESVYPSQSFEEHSISFTIPEFSHNFADNTPESQYNFGYENNIVLVRINMGFYVDAVGGEETISIYNPRIAAL